MAFLGAVDVRLHDGAVGGTLLSPLGYRWQDVEIWVPSGFECDFGSVPGFVIMPGLVPRVGQSGGAFILHDYLYRTCGVVDGSDFRADKLTRKQADQVMRDAMADLRVSWWRRFLAYSAVRIGAGAAWAKRCG